MNFVPMTADDLDAVLAIETRVQRHPWSAGNFRDALAAGYDAWLARDGDDLLGFAILMRAVDEAHLLVIGVAPERQRRGIGRALLDFATAQVRATGIQRMLLEVRPSNAVAIDFYAQAGFAGIGRRRGYYPASVDMGGREDAIVMARTL